MADTFTIGNDRETNLTLYKIDSADTIAKMVQKINQNFANIAAHGGGPAGLDGKNGFDGFDGKDGAGAEYIYALVDKMTIGEQYPSDPIEQEILFETVKSDDHTSWNGTIWWDHPQGVSAEHKNEYMFVRTRTTNSEGAFGKWAYTNPILWSHWGEKGMDGDGVEYIFKAGNIGLDLSIPLKNHLEDDFQRAILGIDDFFPGNGWFNNDSNKDLAKEAFINNNLEISDALFASRWSEKFGLDYGWTDNPTGVSQNATLEYVSIRKSTSENKTGLVWGDFGTPSLWSNYGLSNRTFIIYYGANTASETPATPTGGRWNVGADTLDMSTLTQGWSNNNSFPNGKFVWISSGEFNSKGENCGWSAPVCITGAEGKPGKDGDNVEYIYALSETMTAGTNYPIAENTEMVESLFNNVENSEDGYYDYNSTRWFDNAQAISPTNKKEYIWARTKKTTADDWTYSPTPVLWSRWGEDGTDGDGVEYIYKRTTDYINPAATVPNWSVWQAEHSTTSDNGEVILEGWTDEPQGVNFNFPYEWVAIRKSHNGVWEEFASPVLWSNYSRESLTSFVFAAVPSTVGVNDWPTINPNDVEHIPNYLKGGSYDTPFPIARSFTIGGVGCTWEDSPSTTKVKDAVWMIQATFLKNDDSGNTVIWSQPKKMSDTGNVNVEWCTTDLTSQQFDYLKNQLQTPAYNFGTFLKAANNNETNAEDAFRTAVGLLEQAGNPVFSDNPNNAVYMATATKNGDTWSGWDFVRVKGEKGDDGTSISLNGTILYEVFFEGESDVTYNASNATTRIESFNFEANARDLAIAYPSVKPEGDNTPYSGYLYVDIFDSNNNAWVDLNQSNFRSFGLELELGYCVMSASVGHLIMWDGEHWIDSGKIKGEKGENGIDGDTVYVKYAEKYNGTGSVPVTKGYQGNVREVPEGTTPDLIGIYIASKNVDGFALTNLGNYTWSAFKGMDGFGYEYIYCATNSISNRPPVPQRSLLSPDQLDTWDANVVHENFCPTIGSNTWVDDPMEPTASLPYVWMVWRKRENGVWSEFKGNSGTTNAKLWNSYTTSIAGITEYYHADASVSPSTLATDTANTSYWFTDKDQCGWNSTNRYLFNVEKISYNNNTVAVLNPHLVSTYADGLKDVIEYYIVCNNANTPTHFNISTGVPTITGNGTEGIDFWTSDASKAQIGSGAKYLWNISKRIFEGNKADEWTAPLVIGSYGEGVNGTDSVYIDLDNEMDTIQIDKDRKALIETTCTVHLFVFKGDEKLTISNCAISGEDDIDDYISYSLNENNDIYTFTVSVDDESVIPEYTKVRFDVEAVDSDGNTYIRSAYYTLVGSIQPAVYSIIPSESAIIISNTSAVPTTTPATLNISVVEKIGKNTHTYTTRQVDNFALKLNGTELTNFAVSTSGKSAGDKLTFTVEVGGTVMDTETIFVLKEGKDGAKGDTGTPGNGYEYRYAQYTNTSGLDSTCTLYEQADLGSSTPRVKFGDSPSPVNTYTQPLGADSTHMYEYRIQRYGYYDANNTWVGSNWSNPVIVSKYLDADDLDVEGIVRNELSGLNNTIASEVGSQLGGALTDISNLQSSMSTLASKFNANGEFIGTVEESTRQTLLGGTVKSSDFTTLVSGVIGGYQVDVSGVTKTFSDWFDYENGQITAAGQNIDAINNQISTFVTGTEMSQYTTSVISQFADVSARMAGIDQTIANGAYLTDKDGNLLIRKETYSRWYNSLYKSSASVSDLKGKKVQWIAYSLNGYFTLGINDLDVTVNSGIGNEYTVIVYDTGTSDDLETYISSSSINTICPNVNTTVNPDTMEFTNLPTGFSVTKPTIEGGDILFATYAVFDLYTGDMITPWSPYYIVDSNYMYGASKTAYTLTDTPYEKPYFGGNLAGLESMIEGACENGYPGCIINSDGNEVECCSPITFDCDGNVVLVKLSKDNNNNELTSSGTIFTPDGYSIIHTSENVLCSATEWLSEHYETDGLIVSNLTGKWVIDNLRTSIHGSLAGAQVNIGKSTKSLVGVHIHADETINSAYVDLCVDTEDNYDGLIVCDREIPVSVLNNYSGVSNTIDDIHTACDNLGIHIFYLLSGYDDTIEDKMWVPGATTGSIDAPIYGRDLWFYYISDEVNHFDSGITDTVQFNISSITPHSTNTFNIAFGDVSDLYVLSNPKYSGSYSITGGEHDIITFEPISSSILDELPDNSAMTYSSVKSTFHQQQSRYWGDDSFSNVHYNSNLNVQQESKYTKVTFTNEESVQFLAITFTPRSDTFITIDADDCDGDVVMNYRVFTGSIGNDIYQSFECCSSDMFCFLNDFQGEEETDIISLTKGRTIVNIEPFSMNNSYQPKTIVFTFSGPVGSESSITAYIDAKIGQGHWTTNNNVRTISGYTNYAIDKVKITNNSTSGLRALTTTARGSDGTGTAQSYMDVYPEDQPYLIYINEEISSISQTIGDGFSVTTIMNSVPGEDGKNITAAIFSEATKEGSQITLNADQLHFDANHKLEINSEYFSVKSDNFEITNTGNVLAKDGQGHITAGMIGEDDPNVNNEVKFFAGTSDLNITNIDTLNNRANAGDVPFFIREDGTGKIGNLKIETSGLSFDDPVTGGKGYFSDKSNLSAVIKKPNAYLENDFFFWDDADIPDESSIGKFYSGQEVKAFKNFDVIAIEGNCTIPVGPQFIGRHIILLNDVYKSTNPSESGSTIKMSGSKNYKFYENGYKSSVLRIENEFVELLGYGYGYGDGIENTPDSAATFQGFVVLNRGNFHTNSSYGCNMRVLAFINVTSSGTSSEAFGASGVAPTVEKTSTGIYKITTREKISSGKVNYITTNITDITGGQHFKTSVTTTENGYLIVNVQVYSSGGNTQDGSFRLTIHNMYDMVSMRSDNMILPPAISNISKKNVGDSYSGGTWTNSSLLYWDYYESGSNKAIPIRLNITHKDNLDHVNISISEGRQYFSLTSAGGNYTPTTSSTIFLSFNNGAIDSSNYLYFYVYPDQYNHTHQDRSGYITVTVCDGENNSADTQTISIRQSRVPDPYVGGGGHY